MTQGPKDENGLTNKMQKYVAARLEGKPLQQCKITAGYNPAIESGRIERPGGAVWMAIRKALDAKGLSDDWLADELKAGVERSKEGITRFNPKTGEEIKDPDLAAHERYLGRICKLKGYEREPNTGTQVAVQINNQFAGVEKLAEGEAEILINALRAEIMSRESADVLEASLGNEDPPSCDRVDKPDTETQEETGS